MILFQSVNLLFSSPPPSPPPSLNTSGQKVKIFAPLYPLQNIFPRNLSPPRFFTFRITPNRQFKNEQFASFSEDDWSFGGYHTDVFV